MKSSHFSAFVLSLVGIAILGLSIYGINYTHTQVHENRADWIKNQPVRVNPVELEIYTQIEIQTHLVRCGLFGMTGIMLLGIGILNATRRNKE